MKIYRICGVFLAFSLLCGCKQYYLSICQEWVDATYLASSHVSTPDPRSEDPPIGQKLIIDWRIPKEILDQKPVVVLDLILWDYTTRQVKIPIHHRLDFATYKLLNSDYEKSGGILTYKAQIITENGEVYRQWCHQLWVNLIQVSDAESAK